MLGMDLSSIMYMIEFTWYNHVSQTHGYTWQKKGQHMGGGGTLMGDNSEKLSCST